MARYQVAIVRRPKGWRPASLDDVPAEVAESPQMLAESENLFAAVRLAIEYNQAADRQTDERWAVVIEPGCPGRRWPTARLCTPIAYKVLAIWRPDGWEPESPLDVPNCVWKARSEVPTQSLPYVQALNSMRALNRQTMDSAGDQWYVLMAEENEAVTQAVSYQLDGTETTTQVRHMHVVRPEEGGRGSCAHCPAHAFECAQAEWSSLAQTVTAKQTRQR